MRTRREGAVRLLIAVVVLDVATAAVLRTDRVLELLGGDRDALTWLGAAAALNLLVVLYALARVVRYSDLLRSQIVQRDEEIAAHVATSGEWLWQTTADLTLTYSNPQVTDVLGYTPEQVQGRDAHDFMQPATAARSREALASGLLTDGWHEQESEWVHADGRLVVLRHSGAPVVAGNGTLTGFRGSCSVASADRRQARRLADQERRVRQVLGSGGLTLAFQPIVHVATSRLVGFEALARFADARTPDAWFDEADQVGLRAELELFAVERALAALPLVAPHLSLSINASPEVLQDDRFAAALRRPEVPLDRLVIEVTEHARIESYEALAEALRPLRQAGARLAVDDTGAGYASLTHVLRLRPDIIKLDRSLVTEVSGDRARRTLITALILLALELGASVTAEGVETEQDLRAVEDLGVDQVQGYLLGQPGPLLDHTRRRYRMSVS